MYARYAMMKSNPLTLSATNMQIPNGKRSFHSLFSKMTSMVVLETDGMQSVLLTTMKS